MSIENEIETKEKVRKSAIDMATLKSELLKAGKRKERRERAQSTGTERKSAMDMATSAWQLDEEEQKRDKKDNRMMRMLSPARPPFTQKTCSIMFYIFIYNYDTAPSSFPMHTRPVSRKRENVNNFFE